MILTALQIIILLAMVAYGIAYSAFLFLCWVENLIEFGAWKLKIPYYGSYQLHYWRVVLWALITGTTFFQLLEKF